MTEEEYRQLLADLGFDMEHHTAPDTPIGQALRHTTLIFPNVPERPHTDQSVFWPTLYWCRTEAGLICFATAKRDVRHFRPQFWVPLSADMVKSDGEGVSFVPVNRPGIGARQALESLFGILRRTRCLTKVADWQTL